MTDSKFAGLAEFRCIGPFRGGRVVAVAGDPRDMNTFYFGGVCGGVWKTTDAGQYWENISDGYFTSASVGALEVAPADPNVIYAGAGRNNHPHRCLHRRWHLQIDRCRAQLEAPRLERDAPDRQDSHASAERRPGLRGRLRACLWSQPGAWRLSLEGWRRDLGERASRQRESGRH